MSKKKAKNSLRRPLPGDKIPDCLQGCTTASDVLAKIKTLTDRALDQAARFITASVHCDQAKETLANQLKALVPMLREMQEVLSHKSVLHYQFKGLNLPTFTEWAQSFVADAGIQASWSTIKAAMNPNRESAALRSENQIPTSKLQTQRVAFAALAAMELADAFVHDRAPDNALERLGAAGASKADALAVLKRAGVKDTSEFTAATSSAANTSYFHFESQLREDSDGGSKVRPGGFSQLESLLDCVVGPAFHVAFNLDDPDLQAKGFERLVSYLARKWVPFNANLGTMELTVRFAPKEQPNLRREPVEAPALGRALAASTRLLSNAQASAAINQ